jgi:hypothetical protein
MSASSPPESAVADCPIYWFAILEKAVEQGDHQKAAEAQKELARLGVHVAYGRQGIHRDVAHV